jgi:heme/copper-type cytochrome/quinol oxidase subunit 2
MIAFVKVVTPAQYQTWMRQQQQGITSANAQVQQLRQILTSEGDLGN